MDRIEEIREKIGECDDIIIEQLAVRMSHIQEIISYKKATGIPILQRSRRRSRRMHWHKNLATMSSRKRFLIFSNIS